MYYTSHWSWKCRTFPTTLPSLSSNSTKKQPRWKPTKIQGCHHKPIPIFSSNSLLRKNHTKQFSREEPTHSRMIQQRSAKPERQECLQAPEAQTGTTGGWFSDTHKHQLLLVGTPKHKATRHLPPQGPDPKTQIMRVHSLIRWNCSLTPSLMACSMCLSFVFCVCISRVYSHTEENLKHHSSLLWRNIKLFKANLKYWLLPLWMHQYFQQRKISSYKSSL